MNSTTRALFVGFANGNVRSLLFVNERKGVGCHAEGLPVHLMIPHRDFGVSFCSDLAMVVWTDKVDSEGRLQALVRRERAHDSRVIGAASASDGTFTTCDASFQRIWQLSGGELAELELLDRGEFGGIVAVSATSELWVLACGDHFIRGWSRKEAGGTVSFELDVNPCLVESLAAQGEMLYLATDDRTIRAVDVVSGREKGVYVGHTGPIRQIVVLPRAQRFASLQLGGDVFIWRPITEAKSSEATIVEAAPSVGLRFRRIGPGGRGEGASGGEAGQVMTHFEKQTKALMLRRREGERGLRALKESEGWTRIGRIRAAVQSILEPVPPPAVPKHAAPRPAAGGRGTRMSSLGPLRRGP